MKKTKSQGNQLSLFADTDFESEPQKVNAVKEQVAEATPNVHNSSDKYSYVVTIATPTLRVPKLINSTEMVAPDSDKKVTSQPKKYDHTQLFERLACSDFRSSFHLKAKDKEYILSKGLDTIRQHAADFVAQRLAPAFIPNDGKQTPMRGHPVFIAQHATGCCCRGCFNKWHHIAQGRALTAEEQQYAVDVLMSWIIREYRK